MNLQTHLLRSGSSVRLGEEEELCYAKHSQLKVLLRNSSTKFFPLDLNTRLGDEEETVCSSEDLSMKQEGRVLDSSFFEGPQTPSFTFR